MAGQQLARDEAGNVWEVDANGQPIKLHSPAPAQRQGGVFNLPPDSLTAQGQSSAIGHTQAETTGQNLKNQVVAQTLPASVRQAEGEAAKAELAGRGLDPSVRQKALAQWQASQQLDTTIADMRDKYAKGPGATHGIWGMEDYFPSPSNERFNTAANGARGIVRNALGLTGGEANTAQEANMNLGAYIPQAGQFDGTIEDSIARLEKLRDSSRQQAIATLGGMPDANGVVTPVDPRRQQQPAIGMPVGGAGAPPMQGGPPSLNGGGGRGIGGPGMPGGSPLDGTQQFYRNPTGGPGGGFSMPTEGMISVPDPQRAAQAEKLSAMVADRRNADQAIVAFAQQSGLGVTPGLLAQLKFRKDHPDYNGAYKAEGFGFRDVPMSGAQKAFNAVGDTSIGAGAINAGLSFGQLGNGLTGGALEHAFGDPQQNRTVIAAMNQQHPTAATIGSVGGGIAGAAGAEAAAAKALAKVGLGKFAPRLAPILGDAGFGAAQGAGAAQDGQRLNGALLGGVFGAGGGMLGRGGTKALGGALSGVQNKTVQGLRAAGVPLTFGQAVGQSGRLGATAKSIEDAMTHLPLVGNMISARRREGIQGFNTAAFREALDPIKSAPIDAIAEPGIDAAKQAVGQGYDNALSGVSVTADAPFGMDYSNAMRAGARLPGDMADKARFSLDKNVAESFAPGGVMDGNRIQQSIRGLGRDERSMASQPFGHDFGTVTGQASGAIEGMVNRQAPGVMPNLRAANAANRNVSTLADAVDAARNGSMSGDTGLFMPSQLANASAKNARRFGGSQGTTNQPFYQLSRAGQAVLPSKIGDSGTAVRALVGGTVLGGGTGLGYLGGDTGTGAAAGGVSLLALALGGSKAAQRLLVKSVLDRPDSIKYAGNALGTYGVRPGGMLGAAASPYLLSGTP